jgi:Domain of unknown function (DUF4331)
MSHHFDSPTAIEDGRVNLCDVYAFGGPPGASVLVLTVNPDAGRSSPVTFRPDAVYQFAVDTRGGTDHDLALRVLFDAPHHRGGQSFRVLYATGEALAAPGEGVEIGHGTVGEPFDTMFPDGPAGRGWVGLAADPFWADGAALFAFLQAASEGRYTPEVFDAHDNVFAGRNVTAIVLEVPDALLGWGRSSVWASVRLHGHAPQRQVSRMGQPMLRPLFFSTPGHDTEELNAGDPASDRRMYRERLLAAATTLASLAGSGSPSEHAATVADAFLPDVLGYTPGEAVHFRPGGGERPCSDGRRVRRRRRPRQRAAHRGLLRTRPDVPCVSLPRAARRGDPSSARRALRSPSGRSEPERRMRTRCPAGSVGVPGQAPEESCQRRNRFMRSCRARGSRSSSRRRPVTATVIRIWRRCSVQLSHSARCASRRAGRPVPGHRRDSRR